MRVGAVKITELAISRVRKSCSELIDKWITLKVKVK